MSDAPGTWQLSAVGDRSIVVRPRQDDVAAANRQAIRLARALQAQMPEGAVAIVPGLASVAIHYAPERVPHDEPSPSGISGRPPHERIAASVARWLRQRATAQDTPGRRIDIPVCYDPAFAPDLEEVAAACGLGAAEVVELHTAHPVDVLMLGFAPGHPYLGFLDERLSIGRRRAPRTEVPAGSVGLANRQSVIYPTRLPGGWNLIGRTPLALFDPLRASPSLLAPGDTVRFHAISAAQFETIAAQQGASR